MTVTVQQPRTTQPDSIRWNNRVRLLNEHPVQRQMYSAIAQKGESMEHTYGIEITETSVCYLTINASSPEEATAKLSRWMEDENNAIWVARQLDKGYMGQVWGEPYLHDDKPSDDADVI